MIDLRILKRLRCDHAEWQHVATHFRSFVEYTWKPERGSSRVTETSSIKSYRCVRCGATRFDADPDNQLEFHELARGDGVHAN